MEELLQYLDLTTRLIPPYANRLAESEFNLAGELFSGIEGKLKERIIAVKTSGNFSEKVESAAVLLDQWRTESSRAQNYTAEELAEAQIQLEVATQYSLQKGSELEAINLLHGGVIKYAITNVPFAGKTLAQRMIAAGKEGKKLTVVEISGRLLPGLTFPGASSYFEFAGVPYGMKSREAIGEQQLPRASLVSNKAVIESTLNGLERFNTQLCIAETSAAPSDRVPKSRRKPEVFICTASKDSVERMNFSVYHQEVDTLFRQKFDSVVRELMFKELLRMYLSL